jgi:3-deoxy-D-manno-octulosonic-acid transferase
VGGGFNRSGIHNILEAAVYGVPVVFGPRYERSVEAIERVAAGGAFPVADADTLTELVAARLSDTAGTVAIGRGNAEYVRAKAGATAAVLRHIAANRLLSN